jgi:hypothetical protein
MFEGGEISKRHFLSLLLGGSAWLSALESAQSAQPLTAPTHGKNRRHRHKTHSHKGHHHSATKGHAHPSNHASHSKATSHNGSSPGVSSAYGSPDSANGPARGGSGGGGGGGGGGGAGGGGGGAGGGGGGAGGGGGGWSDRRLKRDLVRMGVSPSGLPIYTFQYVWGGPRYIGVMAQDLLKLRPDAVILDESGYYKVDYARIDVEMREDTPVGAV